MNTDALDFWFYYSTLPLSIQIAVIFIFGLIVGSFINVVVYRLPLILKHNWLIDASNFLIEENKITEASLKNDQEENKHNKTFNLAFPPSHCPSCQHRIAWYENIPLLSYLILKGRCSACDARISLRYPAIELITGLVSAFLLWSFGMSIELAFALIFSYALISLTLIDFDTLFLPDNITLPLLWLGLVVNYFSVFTSLENALLGAIFGYLSLWSFYWLFKLITKKEGMGYGDFKLLAALGAWLGWQYLPQIIFVSAILGSFVGIALMFIRASKTSRPFPFGPYLAIAGWIALVWGDAINNNYLQHLY